MAQHDPNNPNCSYYNGPSLIRASSPDTDFCTCPPQKPAEAPLVISLGRRYPFDGELSQEQLDQLSVAMLGMMRTIQAYAKEGDLDLMDERPQVTLENGQIRIRADIMATNYVPIP